MSALLDTGEINHRFGAALLDPDMPVPAGITDRHGSVAMRRYGVYRNNVVVGLMEAMAALFPSVAAIAGEADFRWMARNFIARHPPTSPLVQAYGAQFGDFLEHFAPARILPALGDVARLERLFLDAFHAADREPLDPALLARTDPHLVGELVFEAHPSLGLLASRHAIVDLFDYRSAIPDPVPDPRVPQNAMVTRTGLEVCVTRLDAGEFALAEQLAGGMPLGAAMASVLETHPETNLPATLALLFQAGAFSQPDMET